MKNEIIEKIVGNKTKESAYFLGLLWGDGHLYIKYERILLTMISEDFETIEPIIDSVCCFTKSYRQRNHWKPITTISKTNRAAFNWLMSHNYHNKSYASLQSILENIPTELQHYWLRGYFDADGCAYFNNKQYLAQFTYCSTYDQDWEFLLDFLAKKGIETKVTQRIFKTQKSSILRGCGKQNCVNFCNLLYPNGYDFGLKRKFDKFQEIQDSIIRNMA